MTDWLHALTLADIILALIALGGLIGGLRYLVPILRALSDFLSDWTGEPARPGGAGMHAVWADRGPVSE